MPFLAAIPGIVAAAGIGAAGSVAGGLIASSAAGHAADTQAAAAEQAAELQHEDAQAALDFQKQVYGNNLSLSMPWIRAGQGAAVNLANLLGTLPPDSAFAAPSSTNSAVPISSLSGTRTLPGFGGGKFDFNGDVPVLPGDNFNAGDAAGMGTAGATTPLGSSSTAPTSLSSLINPALGAPGSLLTPWTEQFKAPDAITEQNDPGYQARLKLGQDVLERSAAAKGNILTGGTAKDLNQFAQDYASNEYSNVYGRAFNDFTNRYNIFKQNQADIYNRLANFAGMGQTSASTLTGAGNVAAGNTANILLGSGAQIGANINNAAAARASGYVGSANALGGAIGGIGNNIMDLMLMSKLLPGSTSGGAFQGTDPLI